MIAGVEPTVTEFSPAASAQARVLRKRQPGALALAIGARGDVDDAIRRSLSVRFHRHALVLLVHVLLRAASIIL